VGAFYLAIYLTRLYNAMQQKNPWTIKDSKAIYQNAWIDVTEYDVINPAGKPGIYGKVHFKNIAVGVVPITPDMHIYLVGQYRFTIDAYSWEIPEGGCPEGTDPLQTAIRELKEETGLVAAKYKELMRLHLSNSVSDELAIIYLATELKQEDAEPEETEALQIKKVSLSDAFGMVADGTITDAMSVAALTKIELLQVQGLLI
jgi:8-oxo-dGTP pyrophosphatase MutT (NUDIX family)